ncbi:LysR family transcriptional regulator [Streptomyces sp. CA2R101]|uniref:LysR family transcriptional regulator n=1 Tax=Streptomyces sp. CA2R101 TaxID=3120152 RepID=UPI003009573D
MLNLDRLRTLRALAQYGSVSAAADVLYVSASAVSQQIHKLEQECGHRIVVRNGRGVELTPVARLLVDRAERILELVDRTEAELQAHRADVVGTLTLGAFPTAARGLVPHALRLLGERAPELELRVSEIDFASPLVQVERGDLDVGVVQDWAHSPLSWPAAVAKQLLVTDTAKVALPDEHPLAERTAVGIGDLVDEPWISRARRSTCHEWLVLTMRSHGAEPRVVHTVSEHPTQLALVAAGVGLAVVPTLGLGPLPAGVRVVDVEPALTRRVYATWRTDGSVRPSVLAAVEALAEAGGMVGPVPSPCPDPRPAPRRDSTAGAP